MKIDYKQAAKVARNAMTCSKLELLLLGHSGAGKSYTIGTLGVPTLYLYGKRESHGPIAASTEGGTKITPLCIDYGVWPGESAPRDFGADESLLYLEAILKDHDYLRSEGYKAIAVDGLRVVEDIVKESTEWKEKCKSARGAHNSFRESEATQEIISRLISWLKNIRGNLDMHVVVTGIIDVKEKDAYGAVLEAVPKMSGYGVAEALIQHFSDIVVTGKMVRNGETKYKLQFLSDLSRASKDEHGNIKKAMNFQPRITGCKPPEMMDANLADLAELAKGRGKA